MTEFVQYNNNRKDCRSLEEIWDNLLRLHWDYLDTEENLQKLEKRKMLENELKDFLCIVQHDRKFFLTETTHVLKQSIMKMDNFSAYKALAGFETISHYANNLFRKPWRKEYRCIKTYCGYYQHEVKTNLIDAEKMFEAMGYIMMSDHTLSLDGSICPDRVTNVSRDAMTAYVECQIMKKIFQELTAMRLQTTWQEIYKFRETHIGTASQAIAAMANEIYEKNQRQKTIVPEIKTENCYSNHAHTKTINCNHYQNRHFHQNHPCNNNNSNVVVPVELPTTLNVPYNVSNVKCSTTIPHSRSLEHYQDPAILVAHKHINARHSLTDTMASCDLTNHTYDCIDPHAYIGNGYRQPHYTSIDHGYGAGHRYTPTEPHYAQLATNCGYGNSNVLPQCGPIMSSTYTPIDPSRNHYECINNVNSYGTGYRPVIGNSRACHNSTVPMPCEIHGKYLPKPYRHQSHQLIDFNEKQMDPSLMYANRHENQQHQQPYNYVEENNGKVNKQIQANYGDFHQTNDPLNDKRRSGYRKESYENYDTKDSRSSRASDFDSFDDSNNLNFERENAEQTTDHSASSKIRDGVGSYETWNYVFQDIGKNSIKLDKIPSNGKINHNVDEINVNGINLNAIDKRLSRNSGPTILPSSAQMLHNNKLINGNKIGNKILKSEGQSTNNLPKDKMYKKIDANDTNKFDARPKSNGSGSGSGIMKKSALKSTINNKSTNESNRSGESTSIGGRTATIEWSCKFCTFLNPYEQRICQMCFKSKDFVSDPLKASTCV